MSITHSKLREKLPSPQKRYRKSQLQKGLVRYEIQISEESKARFEEAVSAAADEYTLPYSAKARKAKARAQIFEEITAGIIHQFNELENRIENLKAEIKALSPSFFITDSTDNTPLPEAINTLPDNPKKLKQLLAKIYQESHQIKLTCVEYKRQAEQFEKLYDAVNNVNEELSKKLTSKALREE